MDNLMLVSNRLPVTIERKKKEISFKSSVGWLATGLASFYKSYDSRWIGWSGMPLENIPDRDRKYIERELQNKYRSYPIFLPQKDIQNYYNGFCNKTIWPLLMYFTQYVQYEKAYWESYKKVNSYFSKIVLKNARPEETIWIHDYHLMLLPGMIRDKLPDARIGFFLHTPFPSFEIFRLLPSRTEVLEGLLGADLIGLHTYDYVRHFLSSVQRLLGYDCKQGKIAAQKRIVKVDTFPIGIDYHRFSKQVWDANVQREKGKWKKKLFGRKVVLSIDRVDYTKGIPQRLIAFDKFLEKYAEHCNSLAYILLAVPSRSQLGQYRILKKHIDELVGNINGKYGSIEWTPIIYLHRTLPSHQLLALYNIADVCMVTSFRDGMNLVAKEYLATKTDNRGVLILSETVGAAKELGEAIIVNPNNQEEIVEGLRAALKMPLKEQKERNKVMQRRIEQYDIVKWAEEFIKGLYRAKASQDKMQASLLTPSTRECLFKRYRQAKKRLFLLDYDGTLMPFFSKPEAAKPTSQLLELLKQLSDRSGNEVVLISGRDKATMDRWFGNLKIAMSAEHGVWLKLRGKDWEILEHFNNDWKQEIKPMLEAIEYRTPGSQIEEKEYSLAWHYRRVDSDLGKQRGVELIDEMTSLSETYHLQIKHGEKTVELKNSEINKGRAALRWLNQRQWDFILAIGDQWTDEDLFDVLPKEAFSIKVGLTPSQAKYNLDSPEAVRKLLKELINAK